MKWKSGLFSGWLAIIAGLALMMPFSISASETISLSVRDTEISEVMEMLSRKEQVNILLSEKVNGKVSVNIYNVSLPEAIRMVAGAGGYEVELRGKSYYIIDHNDVGKYVASDTTNVRTFRLQYAKVTEVQSIIEEQLSDYGSATILTDRNILVIQDTPQFLARIAEVIKTLDYRPRQILIEARILEVTLDESEAFGIEWSKVFDGGKGTIGTSGLSSPATGLFIEYFGTDFTAFLDALHQDGRTRTLSTPKLLALENEAASVIVGDRLGYINTVTINQVTTENTEFLESGVILNVTPSVGEDGKILLDIHPEISTGTVTDGVPSQTTTSVRTQLLVPSGGTSFIGGLIKSQTFYDNKGVPVLRKIPIAGRLFSRKEERQVNTEIIVLITPTIVDPGEAAWQKAEVDLVEQPGKKL